MEHENRTQAGADRHEAGTLESRHNPGGVLPGDGSRVARQHGNLPAARGAAGGTPENPEQRPGAANAGSAANEPGLATILGQIAALNWQISGNIKVTAQQEKILRQPVDPDWVEIKYPDVPYLPVAYYRKTLNDAFGPMGWALVEVGQPIKKNEVYFLPCVLIAEGKPVAKAIGECELKGGNTKLTDGDAMEACRSNAITRCCKSIGIAEELHWPAWIRKFKREHCRELGTDKWGHMVLARKDDEAGASLFLQKKEDSELFGRDPSMVAQFGEVAARIKAEQDLPPPTGRVPREGEPGREEWEAQQWAREQAVSQDIAAEHDGWEQEGE